jgi:hypothetical protein
MTRFAAVPNVPTTGTWETHILETLKQNVELLAGLRGESDGASRAVLRGSVTIGAITQAYYTGLTASGEGYVLSGGQQVPTAEDYIKLVTNVQQMGNDIAILRDVINTLLTQIQGG